MLAGIVSLLEPLAFLGIPIRAEGLEALACGLGLVAADWLLPAREERAARTASRLDDFAPAWQFGERHRLAIRAPRQHVYTAIKEVTAGEILLLRTLTSGSGAAGGPAPTAS